MAQRKGQTGNPNGRPKGAKNKKTIEFQEACNAMMQMAAPQMVKWLEKIAQDDPDKALKHVHSFAQFNFPLLARQDVNQRYVNKDGEDLSSEDLKILKDYEQKILNQRSQKND